MRIGEINNTAFRQAGLSAQREADAPAGDSRSLVAVSPMPAVSEHSVSYRQAAFLAHLIATKEQLPQTRERRRANPDEAIAAYRATAGLER